MDGDLTGLDAVDRDREDGRGGAAIGGDGMSHGRGWGIRPGPVFVYEWVTTSRRWQGYALRSALVLGLLAAIIAVGLGRGPAVSLPAPMALEALAELGRALYRAVVGTQLTLVLIAAPAATAGAICLDRSRGSLTHLLVTDLTDREIVLGKLAARLIPVLVLVAATMPVMELLTLLGGVDPDALFGAYLATAGVTVLRCSLALVFSIWVRRTFEALLATYVVWGLWLLGRPMLVEINRATGWSLGVPPWTTDPYMLVLGPYLRPGSIAPADFWWFLAGTLALSAALVGLATLTVRRAGTRDPGRAEKRRPAAGAVAWSLIRPGWAESMLDSNPVLWREWHRNRLSRRARIATRLFFGLSLLFSLIAMSRNRGDELRVWVNGLHVSVGLLFVGVMAATSLAEERARGSLDILMTTPMETGRIVLGKWLGAFRMVPPLMVLPLLVVLASGGEADRRATAMLLMAAYIPSCGAAVVGLGLAVATWTPRLGRAVGATVGLYLLVNVGWIFGVLAILSNPDEEILGSPFAWVAVVTEGATRGPFERIEGAAFGWLLFNAAIAIALLFATLKTFDRCLGRVEDRARTREY